MAVAERVYATAERLLFSDGKAVVLAQQLVLTAVAVAAVFVVGWAPAMAAPVALALLVGPSWVMVGLFLAYVIASHQYLSPFVFPFGGIEWHPRELLLFFLIAHGGVKLLLGKARWTPHPLHAAMLVYLLFFAQIAFVGILHQPDLHEIIKECRYPLFLSAYFLLALLVRSRKDVLFFAKGIFALTCVIAAAALLFFVYAMVTGNLVQSNQTPLGEFMKTPVGPLFVQTVRPNGHLYYEVSMVVLASLFLGHHVSAVRRLFYLGAIGFLGCAVLITTMRTAYASLLVSLACLVFLLIPNRRAQGVVLLTGAGFGLCMAVLAGPVMYELVREVLPQMDLSLKGRWVEIQGAWNMFIEHPIVGAGMGSSFEGLGLVMSGEQTATGQTTYQTVHNVWIYFLFKGGLVGITLVLASLGSLLGYGYALIPMIADDRDRCFVRGLVAALAGQLVASLAMPRLTYAGGHVFIAMMACAFLVFATDRTEVPEPPPTPEPRSTAAYGA